MIWRLSRGEVEHRPVSILKIQTRGRAIHRCRGRLQSASAAEQISSVQGSPCDHHTAGLIKRDELCDEP